MVAPMVLEPSDQARRRRRSRVTQRRIADLLGISTGAVSEYENGNKPLPFELTPLDYENALNKALSEREAR